MTSSPAQQVSGALPPQSDARIRTISIIGAGVMGRAIAASSVRGGYRVRIADADPTVAADAVRDVLGMPTPVPVSGPHFIRSSSRPFITAAACDADIADSDLVIETIPENLAAKKTLLARIEPQLSRRTIVASNTSSIPIAELAAALATPDRLCGLHFCHPVAERLLVEVIPAATTSAETTDRASAYAAALGKFPVVVGDGPGFALNRILSPYLTESFELLLEGVDVELLDRAARDFGMPWGPLRQLDGFGIDVALAVGGTLLRAFPDRFIPSELLIAMYKAGHRGQKSGRGVYADGDNSGNVRIDPVVSEIIAQRSRGARQFSIDDVRRRLLLPMLLEATRVLEESVVASADVIDAILRDGLGMTPAYRGLFGWANAIGADKLLDWLQPLQSLGQRFQPTPLLLAAVADGAPVSKR